jgi:transposase
MCAKVKKTSRSKSRSKGRSPVLSDPKYHAEMGNPIPVSAQVLRYGVGLDVHKYKIAVCVNAQLQTGENVIVKQIMFLANPKGLQEMVAFMRKFQPISHYLMECTGVYHLPVVHALKEAFPDQASQVVAMNPLLVNRRLTDLGTKNDRVSAEGLANLSFYDTLIRPSYVGSMEFFRLREMLRSYNRSKQQCTRLRNRIQQALDSVNFKLQVDLGAEWCILLLDHYISQPWTLGDAFKDLIKQGLLQNKSYGVLEKHRKEVLEYSDFQLSASTRFVLQMELARLLHEENVATAYLRQAEMLVLQDPEFQKEYTELLKIPGFGAVTALILLVELGDHHRFGTWKAFAKYCGVSPLIAESGESKVKGHINRYTNAYIRTALSQSAGTVITHPSATTDLARYAYHQFHERQLPFKKAMLKVAQKMARICFCILNLNIAYNPSHESILLEQENQKQKLKNRSTHLESTRLRAIRRSIQDFIVTQYDFINSTSRYHLKLGFERVLRKAKYLEEHPGDEKKMKIISKGDR